MIVITIVAASVIGFQAGKPEPAPWRTFVSKEGEFTVDFPTAPTKNESKTEEHVGGPRKIVSALCETSEAGYLVMKTTFLGQFREGAQGAALIAMRDVMVRKNGGKVASEKKFSFEGTEPGLDFTVVNPPGKAEPGIVRIRAFFVGRSVYFLTAAPARGRELPKDAERFFRSFSIGAMKSKKTATTDVAGKEIAGWGTAVDPDGDCQITAKAGVLSITVPASLHDLNAGIRNFNAPRVLRDVEGDFEIQVKVVGDFTPGRRSNREGALPCNGAGIVVCRDGESFIRLERAAALNQGNVNTFAIFEQHEGGSGVSEHNGPLASGTAYLRLVRRGSRVSGFTSQDGKRWSRLAPIESDWPAKLKVGVDAINSGNRTFTVRFEELSFKPAKRAGAGR